MSQQPRKGRNDVVTVVPAAIGAGNEIGRAIPDIIGGGSRLSHDRSPAQPSPRSRLCISPLRPTPRNARRSALTGRMSRELRPPLNLWREGHCNEKIGPAKQPQEPTINHPVRPGWGSCPQVCYAELGGDK
jgi:hypothetical protein